MGNHKRYYVNDEKYADVTAGMAMELEQISRRRNKGHDKARQCLKEIFEICEKYDFRIAGRVILEDKKTGWKWR